MAEKAQHQHNESRQFKPGQILKQARERLGLEQKNIASQLNLQVDTIDAVENDAAERLPAPTYVRGYIRSYARIVRLDADELISLYENDAAEPPEIIPDVRQHHQATSQDKPVKTVTYLITLCLVLLLIAWLQSHYVVTRHNSEEEPAKKEITDTTPASPAAGLSHQVYYYPDVNLSDYDTPVTQLPAYTEPGPTAMDNMLPLDTEVDIAAGTEVTDITRIRQDSEDQITINVNRESWIEIYDSGNNKLHLGMGKPGEEIKINGIAPFNVLLGNAPGVTITFNGNRFNTEPYSKGGVAKFTLGKPDQQDRVE